MFGWLVTQDRMLIMTERGLVVAYDHVLAVVETLKQFLCDNGELYPAGLFPAGLSLPLSCRALSILCCICQLPAHKFTACPLPRRTVPGDHARGRG
jgi:hypothetical protein